MEVLDSFGNFGAIKASIIPQVTPLTKNVIKRIPEIDAAKCAEEMLKRVSNPATANPRIAKII